MIEMAIKETTLTVGSNLIKLYIHIQHQLAHNDLIAQQDEPTFQ